MVISGMEKEMFWTSGADLSLEGRFTWFSSGKVFHFTHWAKGKPDNKKNIQPCVIINYEGIGRWDDMPCNSSLYYICEYNF